MINETESQQDDVPTCFVIGPIGDEHAEDDSPGRRVYEEALAVYTEVIRAACRKHRLSPVRADDIADAGEITEQIRHRLREADIVIADVSGGNPNVMYELGFRDALQRPVILIGESGSLPFDIARMRTIRFQRDRLSLFQARDQLGRFLAEGISRGFSAATADALQSSALPGLPSSAAEDEQDDRPGLFDRLAQAETQMESVLEDIEAMGEAIVSLAAIAEEHTPQMESLNESNAPVSARLAVVKHFSDALGGPATAFRTSAEAFDKRMSDIDEGVRASLDFIESLPLDERDAEIKEFLGQLVETAETVRSVVTEFRSLGDSMKSTLGLSRLLRDPVRDISLGVRIMITFLDRVDVWHERARFLL